MCIPYSELSLFLAKTGCGEDAFTMDLANNRKEIDAILVQ